MLVPALLLSSLAASVGAQITYDDLFGAGTSLNAPQPDAFYAPPADCTAPQNVLQANVKLQDEGRSGGFSHHVDWYGYRNPNGPIRYLPPMDFELLQHSSGSASEPDYLIPTDRGLVFTDHPNWNYIISPGRAWDQEGDNGYSRASVPFALLQRNSQCVHNGVMLFLYRSDGSTSDVRYQITQESCMYFKADFWGQLPYEKSTVSGVSEMAAADIKANFDSELFNRFPTKSLVEDLGRDFPGVDPSVFGSAVPDEHLNTYGVIVDGVQYTTRCRTRYGEYPHCFYMVQPSYSTAKSAFAGLAMMAAAQKYGSHVFDLKVIDLLPREWEEYGTGNWSTVTLKNTLDMASGHYQSTTYMWDEDSSYMSRFFLRESYEEKVEQAFQFRERVEPGTWFSYHSSDTFLTVVGLQQFLIEMNDPHPDAFDFLVENVLKPIGIQEGSWSSIRTIDEKQMAFGGYGMYWIQDDVAKLMQFVHINKGRVGSTQIVDPESLAEAMQQRPDARGLVPNNPNESLQYNYAFWADKYLASSNDNPFTCDLYVPYMSGYGGIRFVMMPNDVVYYYFSDDGQYTQRREVEECDKIRPLCT